MSSNFFHILILLLHTVTCQHYQLCGTPAADTGYVISSDSGRNVYEVGEILEVLCDTGYVGNPPQVQCLENGNWTAQTDCTGDVRSVDER